VPPFYDSLLGKLIVHGATRAEAVARMDRRCARRSMACPPRRRSTAASLPIRFIAGGVDTGFLAGLNPTGPSHDCDPPRRCHHARWQPEPVGATGLHTARMLQAAALTQACGFAAIDFSSSHMAVAVRYFRNNPWERLRRAAAMPTTPLQFITTGLRFIAWQQADPIHTPGLSHAANQWRGPLRTARSDARCPP
jgi:hypothetical protein